MTASEPKRCLVAFATRERQYLWPVELPARATIEDAIGAARRQAPGVPVPWESAPVGIFGQLRARSDVPEEGDRIELYRSLPRDPRAARRERVKAAARRR